MIYIPGIESTCSLCVRWIWIWSLSIHFLFLLFNLLYDDNCQHTISKVGKHCKDLGEIVRADLFSSKQSKRVKLRQPPLVLHLCKNLPYTTPNITHGSKLIAFETAELFSRVHDHFAIKRHNEFIFVARHLKRVTGGSWRRRWRNRTRTRALRHST